MFHVVINTSHIWINCCHHNPFPPSLGQKIVRNLRASVFSSILRQEVAFFDRTRTGELINRLSADTTVVGRSITDNLSDGLRAVAQAVAGVSMMVSLPSGFKLFRLWDNDTSHLYPIHYMIYFECYTCMFTVAETFYISIKL